MDTQDRLDANLPARLTGSTSRLPAQVSSAPRGMAAAAAPAEPMSIDPRSLLRGLARNWWRIALVWFVLAAPLDFLIHKYVAPTYRAFSALEIEADQPDLFGPTVWNRDALASQGPSYLQTEVERLKSDKILEGALAQKGISDLPMIKGFEDQKTELRKKLEVQIVPGTHWVQVALESQDPQEAADIVNAIVNFFKDRMDQVGSSDTKAYREKLKTYKEELVKTIDKTKNELLAIAKRGNIEVQKPNLRPTSKDSENDHLLSFEKVSVDQYQSVKERLFQTDMQLLELEAQYQAHRADTQMAADSQGGAAGIDEGQLRDQIVEEFKRDPAVMALVDEIRATNDELAHTGSVAKKKADPAMVATHTRLRQLTEDYNRLWATKSEQIRQRLLVPTSAPGIQSLGELKKKIDELKVTRAQLANMIQDLSAENKDTHEDSVRATFLNSDLVQYRSRYEQIDRKLEQLEFTKDKGKISIRQMDEAQPPKAPFNNKRLKYMALVPVAILALVLGLFLMLEVKSERVANPDLLSTRVRSEVYALPPLPTRRNVQKLGGPVLDEQIDRFIQRLDHLRFAVCGDHRETDLGRCLLVTSAVGGEGKTTLSAQLAARCGNAGLSTILIDADMRRAALSPLLDVPETPGLSDVLTEEANLEDAIVPLQGGTFSVLPAGSSVPDTTSVLQGRSLALLIAQLRQRYQLIIIDSPPILPVPDALILGRWTDGALLAARFEVSRSPQVERARNQLDGAGIPVLGTVINGMQSSDAYYGKYSYGRYRSTRGESSRGA